VNKISLSWDICPTDPMIAEVTINGEDKPSLRIFLGEFMEKTGRLPVMQHIAEIEKCPWIDTWHKDVTYKILKK